MTGKEQQEFWGITSMDKSLCVVFRFQRFVPGPWEPCSASCGSGTQRRGVRCQVLLSFSQTVAELPDDECQGLKPAGGRRCYRAPCVREAVVTCLNKQTRDATQQSVCVSSRRPPRLLQDCNTHPCPPGERDTHTHTSLPPQVAIWALEFVLSDPGPVQACNRFDCPPAWDTRGWGESPTPTGSPVVVQDCPPQWVTGVWSQCSVSCGKGVQRGETVCVTQGESGRVRTLSHHACPAVPRPTGVRTCSMRPCDKTNSLDTGKPDPVILAERKVYIQWRKVKKLQFVIGGFAYLLPWTTVVLRCPTRRFRKGHIRWLKEGRPLADLPRLTSSPGHLRIQQLQASHVGAYTCVAGEARESFVLKIIGGKRKLSWTEAGGQQLKTSGRDVPRTPESSGELRDSFDRYDRIVRRLLDLKEKSASTPGYEVPEAPELSLPLLLIAQTEKLDAVIRRLSEGLGGSPGEEAVIARLLDELTVAQGDANESTLYPPSERSESSTRGPSFDNKAHSARPRAPGIIQRPGKVGVAVGSGVTVSVGTPVILQQQVTGLEVKCEVTGHPTPTITWTRDGQEIRSEGRVDLLQDGSLRILSPVTGDEGTYVCTATNRHGSTRAESRLLISGGREGRRKRGRRRREEEEGKEKEGGGGGLEEGGGEEKEGGGRGRGEGGRRKRGRRRREEGGGGGLEGGRRRRGRIRRREEGED
ncbi:hypothetical protein NHX12_014156 [Muraenolepis orangiensis]|uniref:Ig-like domain-containing protein n=1 Tax=Muraenolepis orangiensis TaxID=630683 RepID=A0A9Q0DF08_9TELE|nr:hypothetical protein NHX12_014156 [Muraenolepis orangiensis]